MTTKNDGGPAFPRAGFSVPQGFWKPENGMSLRDYFAAKAMQAMVPHEDMWRQPNDVIAGFAYDLADAMLTARENKS